MDNCCCDYTDDWLWKFICSDNGPTITPAYGYIYYLSKANAIGPSLTENQPVPFNSKGIVKGIGIDLTNPNATDIKILNTGIYLVTYYVNAETNTDSGFQLKLNDTLLPNSTYGILQAESIKFGKTIIKATAENSTLQLISLDTTKLPDAIDIDKVNISILIKKIDEI